MGQSKADSAQVQAIKSVFDHLWRDYTEFNPQAKRIYDLILERESRKAPQVKALVNDHIALRTFDNSNISIQALAQHFLKLGYEAKGEYVFENKKLFARHFEHPDTNLPKVFISELETGKCSELVQKVAREAAEVVSEVLTSKESFLWSRRPWTAKYATYQELLNESEYAAWMYAFGYRANHFTISFNHLNSFSDLKELNDFVRSSGYELNSAGGEIKGTPGELLEQSSTLAEKAKIDFQDGSFEVPSCYYEFARRYPKADGELYQGFIAASADKIFESTDVKSAR